MGRERWECDHERDEFDVDGRRRTNEACMVGWRERECTGNARRASRAEVAPKAWKVVH